MMRMEALAAARLGAAVWDRILGLPQRFFPPLRGRRPSDARHDVRGPARSPLRRDRRLAVDRRLPPADLRAAVLLQRPHRLARPRTGPLRDERDDRLRVAAAAAPPAAAGALATSLGAAAATAERHRQASLHRIGRHWLRPVGERIRQAEALRDAAWRVERTFGGVPVGGAPAGLRSAIFWAARGRRWRADSAHWRLPHGLRGLHGVLRGHRRPRPLVFRCRCRSARLRAGDADTRGGAGNRFRRRSAAGVEWRRTDRPRELPLHRRRPAGAARRLRPCAGWRVRSSRRRVRSRQEHAVPGWRWVSRRRSPAPSTTMGAT